ncbi:hypothetical protein [Microbacterium sp. Leaf436]|uniref:hypothetical protein n=1 Tax=Microbacterium sp. Leaf436 TaxID=1736377 RepID=UPI0006F4011A|nr:hypothetical protein [Microbacterium sp. Leaf436]KQT72019.1 hypothetical protein ASG45_13655 [Microbacterium sp. Leaf436]
MPEQFSQSIGRIVYGAGQVEFLIGRMLPGGATGESGVRLVEAARKIHHPAVADVVDGYERMLPDRNHLIHGTYQVFEDHIVAWHLRRGGKQLTSHPYSIEVLRSIADSWSNLAEAAHLALHILLDDQGAETTV